MAAPVFGDKKTIERIDPYSVILIDGLELPVSVLGCRYCDTPLHVEFDDYWVREDEFGAGTINWYCPAEIKHNQGYQYQDQVMRDKKKIVAWIKSKYPTFKNE
jgi:hypothetical protein